MDTPTFDTLARRAADARTRRSALGLVVGAVLGGLTQPAVAGNGGHKDKKGKKGKKGKEDKKQCRKQARVCLSFWSGGYCEDTYPPDPVHGNSESYYACVNTYALCCAYYHACEEKTGEACIFANPY